MKKRDIVKINYSQQKGFSFQWNFQDLTINQIFFRHLFIVYNQDIDFVKDFVCFYHKKIRTGDFFALIYTDRKAQVKFKSWKEKKFNQSIDINKYIKDEQIFNLNLQQMILIAEQQSEKSIEPLILNFLLSNRKEAQQLEFRIKQKRINGKLSYIVSLFGQFQNNHVSVSQGIYLMSYKNSVEAIISFYIKLIYQATMHSANITMESINCQIQSTNQSIWRNTSFNKIQRKFYGPSIEYKSDCINFINEDSESIKCFLLKINLEFKCFDRKVYLATKDLVVDYIKIKKYMKTYNKFNRRPYYVCKDIQIDENPYCSQIFLCFCKQIQPKKQEGQKDLIEIQ